MTQLAQAVGADERTLRRAVSRGTVRCTRISARRVDVSEDEVAYLLEHWAFLERARRVLRTEPNVVLAALFGSLARGHAGDNSDVDVLVDLRDDGWERRQRLTSRLEQGLARPVDLVVLERVSGDNPSVLLEAIRDGRAIVDRAKRWQALQLAEPSIRRAARHEELRATAAAQSAVADLLAS